MTLILGGLQPEQLGGVVATLLLGGSDLGGDISSLGLPLAEHLVEVLAPLLGDESSGVHPLVLHGQVVELVVHPDLGLLGVGHLGGESVDQLLVLNDLGLQLVAGSLELLNAAHALGLEAGLPQLDLSLGLGESLQGIRLPHGLVLHLLPQVLEVGGHHLVLGQQGRAVLALSISQSLGVLQLGGDRDLALVHVGDGGIKLVDLAGKVLVLDLQPLLGGLSFVEGTGHLVQPGVGVHDVALEQLAALVQVSLALDSVLEVATGIAEVELHVGLVLLRLHLVGVEAVNLLAQVSHGVVVLHAKGSKGALVSDVQLLQLRLEAGKLALPLLVQLHLGRGVGAGLLQPGRDVLDVLLQHGAALLGLGAVATLNSQLLVKLLKPGLQLLGLLGVLGAQSSLVVDLGGKSAALLVLAGSSSLEFTLDTLKVSDGLLGELQVSLDLPLGLLNVSLDLLLPLKGILSLIKSLLQLSLNTGQMVALVLGGLDVLLGLLATVGAAPLLLAELRDHVTLVGNLVLEGADLVVLVGPVLLGLGQNTLLSGDLTLQLHHSGVGLGHGGLQLLLGGLLSLDPGVHLVQVLLHIGSLVLNPDGFVNHVLHGGASRLKSKSKLLLLSSKTIVHSLDLGASSNGSVNVGLGLGDLVLVLLLELAELGALEVGLDGQPQLEPEPGLGHHVGPDGALAGVQGHLLVLQLLELHPGSLTASTSLQPGEDGADLVLTLLLHPAANAGPEEDQGVTQPVFLLVQLDDVHDCLSSGLVILGLGDSGGSDDVVPCLELGIGELVGEASTADGNSGKHTVALVLVHHKAGLHT